MTMDVFRIDSINTSKATTTTINYHYSLKTFYLLSVRPNTKHVGNKVEFSIYNCLQHIITGRFYSDNISVVLI